ncbi:MAG: OB-fold nucleic acid binding domain-containing protein, partial [Desulfonatronovibrionaceae bacterium]
MRKKIKERINQAEPEQDIEVKGWVRTRRDSKGFSFLELNDGSCLENLQVVVDADIPSYSVLGRVGTGAAVSVSGDLVESPGKGQKWELRAA